VQVVKYYERWWQAEAINVPVSLVPKHRVIPRLQQAGYSNINLEGEWITFSDQSGRLHLLPSCATMGDLIRLV
jgi:hypothetical protein